MREMCKQKYERPQLEVVELGVKSCLLAGSGTVDGNVTTGFESDPTVVGLE